MIQRHICRFVLAAVVLNGCGLAGESNAFGAIGITGLGRPPGGTYLATATGVSGNGLVVVGGTGNAPVSPFRWSSSSGMTLLSSAGDEISDIARGVNFDGNVVVGNDSGNGGPATAFRWTAAGGLTSLGTLSDTGSTANAVSGDGSVVVGSSGGAFRWTQATGMVALAAGSGSAAGSRANAVSRNGQFIVGQANGLTNSHGPFRWSESTGMVPLGAPIGYYDGEARGVSNDGNVVAGQITLSSNVNPNAPGQNTYAFRWRSDTGTVILGDLYGGTAYSSANAISDDGNVIVGDSNSSYGPDAFYWSPYGMGMIRMWDWLLINGVDPAASGWTSLNTCTGVSADGKTFTGYGVHLNRYEAYVVTVPEPTTLAGIGLAGLLLARRRRL